MQKGFTLIELIAVVVIIGIVSLIVVPKVQESLNTSKKELYNIQKQGIIDDTKNWITDHPFDLPSNDGDVLTISLCDLKIGSYIDTKLTNPVTGKMFDDASKVKIKKVNNKYEYSIEFGDFEENVRNISYPSIKLKNGYLTYLKVGDSYKEEGIIVDGNVLNGDNDIYRVTIKNELGSLDGTASKEGTYLVTYEIVNKKTNDKTTIYRTIIVQK